MISANVIAFPVLKILRNLVSMQKPLLTNNCWGKQNYEINVQGDLTLIFTEHSENVNIFV